MNFDAILFDAAETLFTTQGSVGQIYAEVAGKFGSTATPEEIQHAFRRHFQSGGPLATNREKEWWKKIVGDVFAEVGMVRNFDDFFDEVYDRFRDSRGWLLFPETREVLETLRDRNVPVGIVSNFDSRLYSVMASLGLEGHFKSVTISSEAGFAKPDPRIFITAAESMRRPPERVVMVGDSLVDDYHAGQTAGLHAILLDRTNRYAGMSSLRRILNLREVLPLFPKG